MLKEILWRENKINNLVHIEKLVVIEEEISKQTVSFSVQSFPLTGADT